MDIKQQHQNVSRQLHAVALRLGLALPLFLNKVIAAAKGLFFTLRLFHGCNGEN